MRSGGVTLLTSFKDLMKLELDLADFMMILYVLGLIVLGSVFLGAEIKTIQFDAEKRANERVLNNCHKILVKGEMYQ